MGQVLKILIAEDNPHDVELLVWELRRAGFEPDWTRVDTEEEYLKRLDEKLDLIISDYEMPQFNGLRALELLKASKLEVPFIIISGTIGEDTAVTAMKQGAADYLLKDRLARLESAVRHALDQNKLRLERGLALKTLLESEERLRNIFDGISAFVGLFSLDGRVIELNFSALQTGALRREEMIGRIFAEGPWWSYSKDQQKRILAAIASAAQGLSVKEELRPEVVGGKILVVEATFNPLRNAGGGISQIVVSGIDITDRKNAEHKILEQLNELLRWQDVMLNREDRVQALKKEVNELLARQHLPKRYSPSSES